MAATALMFAAADATLNILSGVFGYLAAKEATRAAQSRARMIRDEANADAQRYAEQARGFAASQRMAYVKSGVLLTGSPLDVLDHDILIAQENISTIRARGAAQALGAENEAAAARISGRSALVGGIAGAFRTGVYAAGEYAGTAKVASANDRNLQPTGFGYNGGGGNRAGP